MPRERELSAPARSLALRLRLLLLLLGLLGILIFPGLECDGSKENGSVYLSEIRVTPYAPTPGSSLTLTAQEYTGDRANLGNIEFQILRLPAETLVMTRVEASRWPNPVSVTSPALPAGNYEVIITLMGTERETNNPLHSRKKLRVVVSDCGLPPWIGTEPRPEFLRSEINLYLLPSATPGVPYDFQLPIAGDAPPFAITQLSDSVPIEQPFGLTLSPGGRLTGIPVPVESFNDMSLHFKVSDSCTAGVRSTSYRARIHLLKDCGSTPVSIQDLASTSASTGTEFRQRVHLHQLAGPDSSQFLDGLTAEITAGTGAGVFRLERTSSPSTNTNQMHYKWFLTGIPTAPGSYTVEIRAQDECSPPQTATKTFTIVVSAGAGCSPSLTAPAQTPPVATVGSPFTFAVSSTGGVGAVTYALSTDLGLDQLPPGLSLSGATISGTPTTPGTTPVRIVATDSCPAATGGPQRVNIDLTFEVEPSGCPALSIGTTSLAAAEVGVPYGATLLASGGLPPYTWTVVGGALPSWATLSTGGVLTGTPASTTGSPFSFTLQVADACTPAQTVSRAFTLAVNPATGPLWDHSELLNRYQAPTTGESAVGLLPNGRPFVLMSAMDGLASGRPQGLILATANIADPINSTDWNVFSMTPGEVVDFSRPFVPAATIIDNRLCIMFRVLEGYRYARALTAAPSALSDFSISQALEVSSPLGTSSGKSLVNLGGKPAYVLVYSETSLHLSALIAASATPASEADWTLHPLLEDAAGRGAEYPQAQVIGGRLAVAFVDRDLSGATSGEPAAPAFALAQVDEPAGAADWLLYPLTAMSDLKTLPGFTQLSDRLYIAAGTGNNTTDGQSVHLYKANLQWPGASTDWSRITVPVTDSDTRGYHCHLTLAGNRLLLSTAEQTGTNKVFVCRAQVANPGSSASDWLVEQVDALWSEPTSPMAVMVGGKARVVYPSAWDEDVYWGYRASAY